ncbi:uncharacterized protein LOC108678969 [Hyalella azteca]|uniref:Uncharacterized protein LOC108678969 n=1 Tax=Hyalella azteca TaxID=294128 RepID=A0A8B7PCJ9_HYAAZ|nr:uncharacterized protein LOC108678969 [Hyalella azteca]
MTNLAPENVTTRAAPGAITLFKFGTTDVAASHIFVTNAKTYRASEQNATCAAENGRPLVIKTEEQLQAAQQAVRYKGERYRNVRYAWLTATFTSGKVLQWPDKTNVTQCLNTSVIVGLFNEHYSMLSEYGNFVDSTSPTANDYPVLCYN